MPVLLAVSGCPVCGYTLPKSRLLRALKLLVMRRYPDTFDAIGIEEAPLQRMTEIKFVTDTRYIVCRKHREQMLARLESRGTGMNSNFMMIERFETGVMWVRYSPSRDRRFAFVKALAKPL